MGDAEREYGRRNGLHFVDAPQRRGHPVQQLVDRLVEQAAEGTRVAAQRDQCGRAEAEPQPAAGRKVPAGQPEQPGSRRDRRRQDGDRIGDHDPSCAQPRLAKIEVGGPIARAAQERGGRHGPGRRRRLLDVGQEVVGVLALQQQRHHPPGRRQRHGAGPEAGQHDPSPAVQLGRDEQGRQDQRVERRCGVDTAHEEHCHP